MKIAIPILHYNKEGGIERHTWEMVERWSKEHDIHIFAIDWVKTDQKVTFHKVPVIKRPSILKGPSFVIKNSMMFKNMDFDIVFNNGGGATTVPGVIIVTSLHKAWAEESRKAGLKRFFLHPLHYWTFALSKFVYKGRRYRKLIAISEMIKRHLIKYYQIPEEDIVVIYHGVNLEEFHPSNRSLFRKSIREDLKVSDQDILLIFVGKEFKRKGMRFVFEALKALNNDRIKLLVIGDGEINAFKSLALKMGIAKNIFFLGHSDNVSEYYGASDIFVFPSTFDAFGMVVLEAMASGLPSIVSRETGASELINDGEDGILLNNYKDVCEIAIKIKLLAENPSLREAIGLKARKKAELHSWDDVAKKTMSVFKEVIGQ